ncbi:MAG: signal recognition particle protein [candidate division Zixibacteria bacterium]|nr:signal recognition particle protein [candidate division Zixibacteria bacterium]
MFFQLTEKFEEIVRKVRGYSRLSEKNIQDALKEVRVALLEADVNYKVVKDFMTKTEEKAVGQLTVKGIMPGQQLIKIVYDELIDLLGGKTQLLELNGPAPSVIMLVGLQGSGKTTTAGKLAVYFHKKGKKSLLVAGDTRRPAAVEQLKVLGRENNFPVFHADKEPVKICREGLEKAQAEAFDLLIIDTAGRLHIDQELMNELAEIKREVKPAEVLLVADCMTGQDAVNLAKEFNDRVGLTGVVLTKMEGDARGGAALSINWVCGKPIRFVGTGEKLQALEPFYPERMASRILGMGDVVSLVEKAQVVQTEKEADEFAEKIRKASFTFEDFYSQLQQIKKMGPLESVLGMLPGMGGKALKGMKVDQDGLVKAEAIINSMTKSERANPQILNGSRRRRIADGSGTSLQEVNKLIKQFEMMNKMFKNMSGLKGSPLGRIFSNN